MKLLWHRFLCWLKIRDHLEYSPPCLGPEVNHPFEAQAGTMFDYCVHCGGGRLHEIHREPYDPKRLQEIQELHELAAAYSKRPLGDH